MRTAGQRGLAPPVHRRTFRPRFYFGLWRVEADGHHLPVRDHDSQPAGPDQPGRDQDLAQLIQWVTDTTGDTQSAIARRIGVAPATVNAWVHRTRGTGRGPNKDVLRRLAAEYKIPEDQVFAAAGRKAPGPLPADKKQRLLALFEELTEEQQRSQEIQIRALVEHNRQGGS